MSELTLVEFLTARLDSDERDARKLLETDRRPVLSLATTVNHPARVLVEVQAKRAIVALHAEWHVCPNLTNGGATDYCGDDVDEWIKPCPTLRLLASVFSDHPDYRQEWAM